MTATGTTHFRNVRVKRQEIVFDAPDVGYGVPYSNTFAQLFLTAIVAGIARAALRDAAALVRSRTRTFYYAPSETPIDDPALQQTIGQIASGAFAAETVVLAAAEALDVATDAFDAGAPDAGEAAHKAALSSAKAKIVADDFAIRAGSLLFDVGGASATTTPGSSPAPCRPCSSMRRCATSTYRCSRLSGPTCAASTSPSGGTSRRHLDLART